MLERGEVIEFGGGSCKAASELSRGQGDQGPWWPSRNLIEKHYGCPMDIEWAIDKDFPFPENIFIVQARPETVWSRQKTESVLGKKSGFELLMERAMKRIKIPSGLNPVARDTWRWSIPKYEYRRRTD